MVAKKGAPGIINYTISNKEELYLSYMPFILHGGLFIRTDKDFDLGDEVFVVLTLLNEPEKFPVVGKVVWLNMASIQGNKPVGIGIQFQENDKTVKLIDVINKALTGLLSSDKLTYTM